MSCQQRGCILEVEKELNEIIHVNPVMSEPDFFYQLEKFYQSESTHWIWLGFVNKAQETSINHTTSVKRFTIQDVGGLGAKRYFYHEPDIRQFKLLTSY